MLGKRVRDKLTGYEGHAVARIEHLHGVPELKVISLNHDGIHAEWIDEARCEEVDARAAVAAGFSPEPSAYLRGQV